MPVFGLRKLRDLRGAHLARRDLRHLGRAGLAGDHRDLRARSRAAFLLLEAPDACFHLRPTFGETRAQLGGHPLDLEAFDDAFLAAHLLDIVTKRHHLARQFVLVDLPGVADGFDHLTGFQRQ